MSNDDACFRSSSEVGSPDLDQGAGQADRTHKQDGPTAAQPAPPRATTLGVRCPHCHNSCQVPESESLSGITCPACGSHFDLVDPDATLPLAGAKPRTIGGFVLIEQAGVGQYGTVWKARDSRLDRVVAVKVPRRSHLDPGETEQFLREARSAAQVHHPNVVSVHEVGREGDTLFIVSDYVEGCTLAERLRASRFTCLEAARFCATLADALHEAHAMGVVHRDLKPGNIMIGLSGEPFITDFGLAKRETGEVTMTIDGQILGTPAYMSPEQARGEGHRADRRTDVYSLGVILYELLTGERPFRGESRMLVLQVLREEPPRPSSFNGRIPSDLEAICLRCLEKEPGRRYQSARELSDDLRRFLDGQPVVARPVGPLARAWRWYRRHSEAPAWIAGASAVFSGVFLFLWECLGMIMLLLGVHSPDNPIAAFAVCAMSAVAFALPLACAGLYTLRGHHLGLWAGAFLAAAGLALTVVGISGGLFDEGFFGNRVMRLPLFSLLMLIALLGLVLHIVALISRTNPKTPPS